MKTEVQHSREILANSTTGGNGGLDKREIELVLDRAPKVSLRAFSWPTSTELRPRAASTTLRF